MPHVDNSAGPAGPPAPDQPEPALRFGSETITWRPGDPTRKDPLFIQVINNPALERLWLSGNFVPDMVGGAHSADRNLFAGPALAIVDNLFGRTGGQAEKLLGDSPHVGKIKVASTYVWGLPPAMRPPWSARRISQAPASSCRAATWCRRCCAT